LTDLRTEVNPIAAAHLNLNPDGLPHAKIGLGVRVYCRLLMRADRARGFAGVFPLA